MLFYIISNEAETKTTANMKNENYTFNNNILICEFETFTGKKGVYSFEKVVKGDEVSFVQIGGKQRLTDMRMHDMNGSRNFTFLYKSSKLMAWIPESVFKA